MVSNSSLTVVSSMLFLGFFLTVVNCLHHVYLAELTSGLNCLRLFSLTNAIRTPNDCATYFLSLH